MWEIFSGGEMPYSGMRNIEVVDFVINNRRRLPKPDYCPEKVYQILNLCWEKVCLLVFILHSTLVLSEYNDKIHQERKVENVSFNNALNTFYLRLYGIGHMVK